MLAEAIRGIESSQAIRSYHSCVRIGEILLALNGASPDEVRMSRELQAFRTERANPEIEVCIEWVDNLRAWQGEPEFHSGALWTLFRDGEEHLFDFISPALGADPYKRLR